MNGLFAIRHLARAATGRRLTGRRSRAYYVYTLLCAGACGAVAAACHGAGPTGADGPTSAVRERWYAPQRDYAEARPAVAGDTVYFGTGDGHVVARRTDTGAALWTAAVGTGRILGANLVVRAGVVVVPVDNYTVGLDAATGRVLWRYASPVDAAFAGPGSVVRTRIDADDQTAYVPAWGASVSALDLRTGAVRWVWRPGRAASDTGAAGPFRSGAMGVRVSGDTVFATAWHYRDRLGAQSEPWLLALDRQTGRELWRVPLPVESYTSGVALEGAPALAGTLVLVAAPGGQTFAVDRATQAVMWEFRSPQRRNTTLAEAEVRDGVVYFDGGDGNVYARRAADGSPVWAAPFTSFADRDLLVTERRVIFPEGQVLHVLDRASGRELRVVQQPHTNDSFFASAAAAGGGGVFVTVGDGAWCFEEP